MEPWFFIKFFSIHLLIIQYPRGIVLGDSNALSLASNWPNSNRLAKGVTFTITATAKQNSGVHFLGWMIQGNEECYVIYSLSHSVIIESCKHVRDFTFSISNGTVPITTSVTISHLTTETSGLLIGIRCFKKDGSKCGFPNITLPQIADCPNITKPDGSDSLVSIAVNGRTYDETAVYTCLRSSVMFVNGRRQTLHQFTRTCQYNATWDGLEEVACYKGPTVAFVQSRFENGKYNLSAVCDVQEGFPNNASTYFSIRDETWSNVLTSSDIVTLLPEHNGLTAYCNSTNGLLADGSEATLTISFGPKDNRMIVSCSRGNFDEENRDVNLTIEFTINPSQGSLNVTGSAKNKVTDKSCREINGDYHAKRKICLFFFNNVTSKDIFLIEFHQQNDNRKIYQLLNENAIKLCPSGDGGHASTTSETTFLPSETTYYGPSENGLPETATTSAYDRNSSEPANSLSVASYVGIAFGGFVLLAATGFFIFLIVRRQKKQGFHGTSAPNPAFEGSSASGNHGNSEQQECTNIIYGSSDDLKSGGNSSQQMVDNVLYGTTTGPQVQDDVYTTVNKTNKKKKGDSGSDQAAELYSSVQKPKKTKGKAKGVDPGASTSGLQSDDTYAEVNKDKKRKRDGKKTGKGQENSGFAGDAQQDATYAVVDRKKKKGAKGKKADVPETSGLVEEATYAVVNKKDKKPKKDGPDDDLHGSNKS